MPLVVEIPEVLPTNIADACARSGRRSATTAKLTIMKGDDGTG
jgi:hypothetical protein